MSTPCSRPHQRRALARPTKFDIVAPLVITPLQAAGIPNRSFNQSTVICSMRAASGELTQLYAFWSRVEASQSAASAAGVPSPITKWKNRGPEDRVAASIAAALSSVSAFSDPTPSSGIRSSRSAFPGGWTSDSSSESTYASAARSICRSAAVRPSRSATGSGMADTIDGVAVLVVDLRGVLVPVSGAGADRDLLGTDHHVVDAVFADEVQRVCVALEDLLVVVRLLDVVGKPIGPEPTRVADELAPPRERGDRAVVLVGHRKDGRGARVSARPIGDLQSAGVREQVGARAVVRGSGQVEEAREPEKDHDDDGEDRGRAASPQHERQHAASDDAAEQRPEDEELGVVPGPGLEHEQVRDQEPPPHRREPLRVGGGKPAVQGLAGDQQRYQDR